MTTARGNPLAVQVGPGKLYIAPLNTTEPTNLSDAWPGAWVPMGYTDEGSEFVFNATFEDVEVAEELEPIETLQTQRMININFALAEMTGANMQRAFNGGDIQTPTGLITFEPPAAGDFTPAMLGWESENGMERWVFRRCIQVGNVAIPRRKAPAKAIVPMSFRATQPPADDHGNRVPSFLFIQDADFS